MTKDTPLSLLYAVYNSKVLGKKKEAFAKFKLSDVLSAYNTATPMSNYPMTVVADALAGMNPEWDPIKANPSCSLVITAQLSGDSNRTMEEVAESIGKAL